MTPSSGVYAPHIPATPSCRIPRKKIFSFLNERLSFFLFFFGALAARDCIEIIELGCGVRLGVGRPDGLRTSHLAGAIVTPHHSCSSESLSAA